MYTVVIVYLFIYFYYFFASLVGISDFFPKKMKIINYSKHLIECLWTQ